MNLPNRTYKTALRSAWECGCEKVANPGHEDCTVWNAQENFTYYANVEKFSDLTSEQKKDFWSEWRRGIADEKKACGLE
tara:strand:+ start:601 stop:837 length:237 start_codon:yes stop_codon:yes gene_type:complete